MQEQDAAGAVADSDVTVVDDLDIDLNGTSHLEGLRDVPVPEPLKDPVDRHPHRQFDDSEFWRRIPAYADVDREQFLDHSFQNRASVTTIDQLADALGDLVDEAFLDDVRDGMARAPMAVRISPYLLSRIDWERPYTDPLRIQFLPVASLQQPDHPRLTLDSLHEQDDSPTPGLVHRYPDKVLFLPLDVCPVYCRFCTRSYAIGTDSGDVKKVAYKPNKERWNRAFAYLLSRPEVEDVVVSGGDAYMLPQVFLREIGEALLEIPHIRRIRIASKGPAVMPMKILSDDPWVETLRELSDEGRRRGKEVCLHTHFNCTAEITDISRRAMLRLFRAGIKVRNQAVLIRGVNDDVDEMTKLVKQLSWMNVEPYYVYQHDMVKHVEGMRTTVATAVELERHVRGATAGFNTPTFVVDAPGGGGKRGVHSFDYYDEVTGISIYRSPAVDEKAIYLYFDPLDQLPEAGRERWSRPEEHEAMICEAITAAGLEDLEPAIPVSPGGERV